MRRASTAATFLALCVAANGAAADSGQSVQNNESSTGVAAAFLADTSGASPGGQSLPVNQDWTLQAAVNSDQQTATVSAVFNLPPLSANLASNDYLTVTAQSPVLRDSTFVNIASLDGMAKSSSITFKYSGMLGAFDFDSANAALLARAQGKDTADALLLANNYDVWLFSLDGKVGSQKHDYIDPATLASVTSYTTSWQAGGSVGYVFDKGRMSFSLSADYQEFYQDGGDGMTSTTCLSSDNCATGFIGAPVLTHQALITSDMRWIGSFGKHPLGAELKVTYDPIGNTEAVELPVYLMTDDKGGLTGGVRYDWTSTNHISTVGVFVSSAFSLGNP